MQIQLFFAWFCIVYALVLFWAAFMKNAFFIKMVKMKFGKKMPDERAITIMFVFAAIMAVVSIILFIV